MRSTRVQCEAFTLLEMLVALALMGIVAVSLYASLRIGFKARESVRSALEPVRRTQLALDLVGADIRAALPPAGVLAGEFIGQNLVGDNGQDSDVLVLHVSSSVAPSEGSVCGTTKIELALSLPTGESGPALVRRVTTQLLAPETPEPREEVLCRNVSRLNIRYFDGSDWLDVWDSTTQNNLLPLAVEVAMEVKLQDESGNKTMVRTARRVFLLPCGSTASEGG